MPAADPRTRAATSPALRRFLPRSLALSRAAAQGERRWRVPSERARALAVTEAIVAGTGRAQELTELARRRLIEEQADGALFWEPWRVSELDGRSAAALGDALGAGRRLILSVCHLGPYFLQCSPLKPLGISTIFVSGPWFFEVPEPGLWGRRLARWRRGVEWLGGRLVPSAGSFEVVRALIETGEVVTSYFDMPGSTRTAFLGKPVDLSAGTSRLAHQTGALILPLRARRDGTRVFTDVWQAIDARRFAGPGELHEALAAVHERSILEIPEALEDPTRPGAWEQGASPSEWARPGRD